MKKRISLLIILLSVTAGFAFGQKKEISQAKANIKAGNNLEQAEQSMRKLLKDSANRENEKIWITLFDVVRKQYDLGNEKLYLKQQYDTAALFVAAKKMFEVLESFDSVDARPNSKGRVEPQYRSKHARMLNVFRPNLYSGGAFFVKKQQFDKAYDYFDAYLDCGIQPLFSQMDYSDNDSLMRAAAYWAMYCGYRMKNPAKTLHHTYLALKDTARMEMMLQMLAETYELEKDTTRFVKTLQEGFLRYPFSSYFFPVLVQHYAATEQWERALQLADQGLAEDSTNKVFRFTKSTVLLNVGNYKDCITICDSLIAQDDSLAVAYLNAGLSYFNIALQLDKNNLNTTKQRQQEIAKNYQSARRYLERYRVLAPEEKEQWALPLYTIYLNLNMGKEFDEIERLIRNK